MPASRPLVLMYHAVDTRSAERDPDNLFVPAEAFAAQLELLDALGRRPCSLAQYLDGSAPAGSVLLTFDDAYVSTLERAAPLLAARGWPAVVYVSSRTVGGRSYWNHDPDEPLLDLDGLRDLQDAGFEVGAHARDHVDLRGRDDLVHQVAGSGEDLRAALGAPVRTFAYPFGLHDAAARAAAARAGYDLAFSVHEGVGRFAVARVDVNATDTPRTFRLKLRPSWRAAKRVLDGAPAVRRAGHRLLGSARA